MNKFLRIALQYANEHKYEGVELLHCALIVRGGKIISVGYNSHSANSFVNHYTNVVMPNRDYEETTHAEMDAVRQVRSKIDLRGTKIYVIRRRAASVQKKLGALAISKPCEICQHVLYNYGISRAYYSISDTEYGVMKVVNPAKAYQNNIQDKIFCSHQEAA